MDEKNILTKQIVGSRLNGMKSNLPSNYIVKTEKAMMVVFLHNALASVRAFLLYRIGSTLLSLPLNRKKTDSPLRRDSQKKNNLGHHPPLAEKLANKQSLKGKFCCSSY